MKSLIKYVVLILILVLFTTQSYAMSEAYSKLAKKNINKPAVINAIETYSEKINQNPTSEDAYINRAYCNYLLGNFELAIEDYTSLIKINPKNEEFFLNRGYLYHISNKRSEALSDYESALQIKPDYAFALNNKGVVLSELGKNEASLKAYNDAIAANPNYADAYYNRGNLKTKTNKNEEALNDYTSAIQLNPHDAASFNNRGVVKRKLNFNVGALSDFSIAIKLDPEDITAHANRGHLKKRYFDSEGAEEDFKTAINLAEASPTLVKEIESATQVALNQKPEVISATTPSVIYKEAPADLNKALRMPKVNQAEIQKISQRIANNSSNEANIKPAVVKASVVKVTPIGNTKPNEESCKPEISTKPVPNPELAECYYIRALQKYIVQNRESAMKDFNMAIEHNPNYAEAYYYRAAIKRDNKDESFIEDYRTAVKLKPELKSLNEADVLMILK